MKPSLRVQLNNLIQMRGSVPWEEIKQKCEGRYFGRIYKLSNAERRLRASESPQVETEMRNGHIVRYIWKGSPMVYRQMKVLGLNGQVEKVINVPVKI